jgi:hypothetical protein
MAEQKDAAVKSAEPAVKPAPEPVKVVKGRFIVCSQYGYALYDPYQKIRFTRDDSEAAELTSWVKSQIDAGLLKQVD